NNPKIGWGIRTIVILIALVVAIFMTIPKKGVMVATNEKPINSPPTDAPTTEPKKAAKKTSGAIVQNNKGGTGNTNTQVGTAQGPIAIAPNGIANAAPNF